MRGLLLWTTVVVCLSACDGDGGGRAEPSPTETLPPASATTTPIATTTTTPTDSATPTATLTQAPTPSATATAIDDPALRPLVPLQTSREIADYGRDVFENETFGNEVFWTGIVGILAGGAERDGEPLPLLADVLLPALDALDGVTGNLFDCPDGVCNGGGFTRNLVVQIPDGVSIDQGRISLPAGAFATGLAVPTGRPVPLGVVPIDVDASTPGSVHTPLNADGRAFSFGVSCALCHTTVGENGEKIDGLPNRNLQVGILFALAANSSALFPLSGVKPADDDPFANGSFDLDGDGAVDESRSADFEAAVDASFLNMPKGYFDATPDAILDPNQIPNTIAEDNGPYLWDGLLPDLSNVGALVHGIDLDLTALAGLASTLGLTSSGPALETSLYRLAPARGAGFATFDDYDAAQGNGVDAPGVLRIAAATHSGIRPLAIAAPLASGIDGFRVARPDPSIAGLSADDAALEAEAMFQRSRSGIANNSEDSAAALASGSVLRGARLEEIACAPCHPAPSFNFNGNGSSITPLVAIATEPSRAGFGAGILKVDGTGFQTTVGYKNQSHRFLFATPPYLHDGGLAAADTDGDGEADVFGVVDTLLSGIDPEPRASLQALLDPALQQRCVEANAQKTNPLTGVPPADVHITGEGHPFYVAEGVPRPGGGTFTRQDREDLIDYLLALDDEPGR